jgi:hypothetical protein
VDIVKWDLQLTLDEDEVVPPFVVDEEKLDPDRWGADGVAAARLFAALIGIGYRAIHDVYLEQRLAWIAEQERAGHVHQVLAPNFSQTVDLQRECRRRIQQCEAWNNRLVGNPLGEVRRTPGGQLLFEIDLRERSFKLRGAEADIGKGQELYLLAALGEAPDTPQSSGELTEMMRRLGYRHRKKDAAINVPVSKSRLLKALEEAAHGLNLDVRPWIEGIGDTSLRLCLQREQIKVHRDPLLQSRK